MSDSQKMSRDQSLYLAQIKRIGGTVHKTRVMDSGELYVRWSKGGSMLTEYVPRDRNRA